MALYVLDTSGLIDGWSRFYPKDVFPALWEHFEDMADAGDLLIPNEVLLELAEKDDDLHAWVKARSNSMVQPTSTGMMETVREILLAYPGLTKAGTGRGKADPWVIALARSVDCKVVTGERGGSLTRPRIPFVCDELGIDHCNILDLIREQGLQFRR